MEGDLQVLFGFSSDAKDVKDVLRHGGRSFDNCDSLCTVKVTSAETDRLSLVLHRWFPFSK